MSASSEGFHSSDDSSDSINAPSGKAHPGPSASSNESGSPTEIPTSLRTIRPRDTSSPITYHNSSPPAREGDLTSSLVRQSIQIHPKFLENQYATEPTYFTRPNRFFGAASTWRSWTEADRAVSDSLDRLRAQDLSVHLYNAYALKRRSERVRNNEIKGKGKEGLTDDSTFAPPTLWTAWPLPPGEVPREDFLHRSDEADGAVSMAKDQRPSATLEECLIAATTKFARERWESRDWEVKNDSISENKQSKFKGEKQAGTNSNTSSINNGEDAAKGSLDASGEGSTTSSSSFSSASSSPAPVPALPPAAKDGVQYFSSQVFAAPSSSTSSEDSNESSSKIEDNKLPVFTADDDRTRDLVLPSTRHTISKLDDLFLAMHKSRRAYAYGRGEQSKSRSRSQSQSHNRNHDASSSTKDNDEDDDKMDIDSNSDTNRGRDRKSRKRRRQASAASSPSASPRKKTRSDYTRSQSQSRSRSRSKSFTRSRSAALQPHDWSSIIGMASMLGGFSAETVARASERCALLFGENMLFRTFHEVGGEFNLDTRTKVGDKPVNDEPHFDQYDALGNGDESASESGEAQLEPAAQVRPSKLKGSTSSASRSALTAKYNNDGAIYCPVKGCTRADGGKSFSKGSKMYHHVRKSHPGLEIDKVKQAERQRRGERRGRWTDERRHRSRDQDRRSGSERRNDAVIVDDN